MANKSVSLKDLLAAEDPTPLLSELSFEDGLKLLEELVQKVEAGSLPLDTAIRSYEKGVGLVERLRTLLSSAEEKLQVLQKTGKRS